MAKILVGLPTGTIARCQDYSFLPLNLTRLGGLVFWLIIDLDRACFQSANITRLAPYWTEEFPIDPQHLQAFLDIEKSGKSDEEKEEMIEAAIAKVF